MWGEAAGRGGRGAGREEARGDAGVGGECGFEEGGAGPSSVGGGAGAHVTGSDRFWRQRGHGGRAGRPGAGGTSRARGQRASGGAGGARRLQAPSGCPAGVRRPGGGLSVPGSREAGEIPPAVHPGWRRGSGPPSPPPPQCLAQPFGPGLGTGAKLGGLVHACGPGGTLTHALPSGCSAEASPPRPPRPAALTSAVAKKKGDTAGAGDWEGAGPR